MTSDCDFRSAKAALSGTRRGRLIKKLFPRAYIAWWVHKSLTANRGSYLYTSGWVESLLRGYPSSPKGDVVPWMNSSVVALLASRLNKEHSVFEFGSGYSTIFYAQRVKSVVAVEHDEAWYAYLKPRLPVNAELVHEPDVEDGSYSRTILRSPHLVDVAVVDGRDRVSCTARALERLSDRGILVLDDSDRERYAPVRQLMAARGFRHLDIEGLRPACTGRHTTTIFYTDGNCLGI